MLLAGMYEKEDLVFLDLETLGFFSRPIILFGVAEVNSCGLKVSQYLVRDICEEPAALRVLKSHLGEDRVLVTYNGKSFDVPYLAERYAFYGDWVPGQESTLRPAALLPEVVEGCVSRLQAADPRTAALRDQPPG
jgi:Predicted exonuclease